MYNNLNILSYPVNRTQLLIHLTLWTFSVGSIFGKGLKQKVAETDDFLRLFGMARRAFAPSGRAMIFIGYRIENQISLIVM